MPRIKTLKVPPQKFDFFTFEELEVLVAKSADEPERHAADIDFKDRMLTVMRNDWRGSIGAPKSVPERKSPLTTR